VKTRNRTPTPTAMVQLTRHHLAAFSRAPYAWLIAVRTAIKINFSFTLGLKD
jgi:hypothetical protein